MAKERDKERDQEQGKMKTEYLVEFPDGTVKNAADLTKEEMDMMDYYINAASSRVPGYKVLTPETEDVEETEDKADEYRG